MCYYNFVSGPIKERFHEVNIQAGASQQNLLYSIFAYILFMAITKLPFHVKQWLAWYQHTFLQCKTTVKLFLRDCTSNIFSSAKCNAVVRWKAVRIRKVRAIGFLIPAKIESDITNGLSWLATQNYTMWNLCVSMRTIVFVTHTLRTIVNQPICTSNVRPCHRFYFLVSSD